MNVYYLVLELDAQTLCPVHLIQHVANLPLNPHHGRALVQKACELGHSPSRTHAHELT